MSLGNVSANDIDGHGGGVDEIERVVVIKPCMREVRGPREVWGTPLGLLSLARAFVSASLSIARLADAHVGLLM